METLAEEGRLRLLPRLIDFGLCLSSG